ncbi:MAG: glycine cleavage system protein H [Planctomyces sp.]|nr:glycine cleavage system protein H [Planctomyces sp.]MBA4039358.1 glycine cleavage system protein H [Planctomyces sp.]MBA4119868.1 glycine cleavage system protein H [Isosphaera sp.]
MPSPADRSYADTHEWHRHEGDLVVIGLTKYAVNALTDVTYVSLRPVGTAVEPGKPVGEVESVKTTSDVYSAVAGQIVETNAAVVEDPSRLNADPYSAWLVKLRAPGAAAGLSKLHTAANYDAKYPTA